MLIWHRRIQDFISVEALTTHSLTHQAGGSEANHPSLEGSASAELLCKVGNNAWITAVSEGSNPSRFTEGGIKRLKLHLHKKEGISNQSPLLADQAELLKLKGWKINRAGKSEIWTKMEMGWMNFI